MAELVYDVADGVSFYIANSSVGGTGGSDARMRWKRDVQWMIDNEVDIIVRSGVWSYWEGLGDGVPRNNPAVLTSITKAVTPTSTYPGAVWVNSVGNDALNAYHSKQFRDNGDTSHAFSTGDNKLFLVESGNFNNFYRAGGKVYIYMRWDDSWDNANCDMDMTLMRVAPGGSESPVASSHRPQWGRADEIPVEGLSYPIPSGETGRFYLAVFIPNGKVHGCPQSGDLDWFDIMVWGENDPAIEHRTPTNHITVPNDSREEAMLSVGAVDYRTPGTLENYSSRGPTNEYIRSEGKNRVKPDVTGAACGTTEYKGGAFCGTSSAAPVIGAIAALLKERFGTVTPKQIAHYLDTNTEPKPNSNSPKNNYWGHGIPELPDKDQEVTIPGVHLVAPIGQTVKYEMNSIGTLGGSDITLKANGQGSTGAVNFGATCPAGGLPALTQTVSVGTGSGTNPNIRIQGWQARGSIVAVISGRASASNVQH